MAQKTETNEPKITIKVIADKVNKRVVYAEANHTFVDILFGFITLPMGTIVRLLQRSDKKFHALGSFNNLYKCLNNFPENFLETEECKYLLLNPRSSAFDHCSYLKLNIDDTEAFNYFECESCCDIYAKVVSTCNKAKCRFCGKLMEKEAGYSKSKDLYSGTSVFASDIATFIVTDDLHVMPYTSANIIRLLTRYGVTEMSQLEEIKFDLDSEQILCLLKMAISQDTVLTNLVFKCSHSIPNSVAPAQISSTSHLLKNLKLSSSSKIHIEVSLQKSTGKLLFAEAKQDFVEFLFGFLSLPIGTVIGTLVKGDSSIRCMDNIFESISNMSAGKDLRSRNIKDPLLKPHIGQRFPSKNLIFPLEGTEIHYHISYLKDPRKDGRLLKQSGMFTVTDDLIITPSSSFSTIKILNDLQVPFDDVEKCEICIGFTEGLKILEACLASCSTLTDSIGHQLKK